MFDYTQGALNKVLEDFKKLALAIHGGVQILSILFLSYALITSSGFFVANLVLLILTSAYLLFLLVMECTKRGKATAKRLVREIYRWNKRVIRLAVIGLTLYALFVVSKNFTPLSLVLLILMIVGFIFDLIFYFLVKFLTAEVQLLMAGVKKDAEEMKKPVQSVGNFFKKMAGREIEEPTLSKKEQRTLDILEEQSALVKNRKKQKKQEIKMQNKEKLQAQKQEKKEKRAQDKSRRKQRKNEIQAIPAPLEEENE